MNNKLALREYNNKFYRKRDKTRIKEIIKCEVCNAEFQRGSLPGHLRSIYHKENAAKALEA